MTSNSSKQPSAHVTEARAAAQRTKLDTQAERRRAAEEGATQAKGSTGKGKQASLLSRRRASTTMERAIADYLLDHEGGNSSQKTLQWHQTALGLLRSFLQEERGITLVGEVDAPDINAWFASMRKTPSSSGKIRCERTPLLPNRHRNENGLWFARRGQRNRLISAVLLVDELMLWAIAHKTPVLWHNPWAEKPLDPDLWQGPQMLPDMNASSPQMQCRDGKQAFEFLHLSPDWPNDEAG